MLLPALEADLVLDGCGQQAPPEIALSRDEGELLTVPKTRAVSLSPCALQRSQSESRGPEIGTPGLMSGERWP